jgi:hypothetical protein
MLGKFVCPDCGRTSDEEGLEFEQVQFAVGSTPFVCEKCIQSDKYVTVEPPFIPYPVIVVREWCAVSRGEEKNCPVTATYCGDGCR